MLESFRSLAAHIADKCSDDMRLERKVAKTDSTGYQIGESKPYRANFRAQVVSVIERVGFNGATKITGLRLQVPTTCGFSDFCVGDKITPLCGPYHERVFVVGTAGGPTGALARIDRSGFFLEIDIVEI